MTFKALAEKLVSTCGTRDPFRIAAAMGFIIIETPLEGIRGYYQYIHRCHIIYIDSGLTEPERRWVCAHELGHYAMHRGLNRVFMDKHTLMVTNRYENEADRFAMYLLFSDDYLRELAHYSIDTVAQCLGVSRELAEYRMSRIGKS